MYLDPGAGSLVVQVLSAGVLTALGSLGRVRRFFASLLRRRRDR
jgi:hypothetical protein